MEKKYKLSDEQTVFIKTLLSKCNIELLAMVINDNHTVDGIELIDILKRILIENEYNIHDKLILNALRYKIQHKI